MALTPLLCGTVITACSSSSTYPPLLGGPFEGGTGGGGVGTGGGEAGTTPCAAQGGQCVLPGNLVDGGGISCPTQLFYSCGQGSVTEAGPALICCGGYNDAGAPDVIVDTGAQ